MNALHGIKTELLGPTPPLLAAHYPVDASRYLPAVAGRNRFVAIGEGYHGAPNLQFRFAIGRILTAQRSLTTLQKNILGLVQGAAARIDLDLKTERGQPYKKTAPVKTKTGETEDIPLYTNKDNVLGEVRWHIA